MKRHGGKRMRVVPVLAAVLFVLLSCSVSAQMTEATPEAGLATDLWQFTWTETDGATAGEEFTFNVELNQFGEEIYGSIFTDQWMGRREKDRISMKIFSQSAKGESVDRGTLTPGASFEMRKNESGVWKGKGVMFAPGSEGESSFQPFKVTAKKLSPNSGQEPLSFDWCSFFGFDALFHDIYSGIPVHSIKECGLDHNGDGYYLYGTYAPGSGSPIGAATAYLPYKLSGCHTKDYSFWIKSGDKYHSADTCISELRSDTAFKNYMQLSDSDIDDLAALFVLYGDYSVSVGYNANTKSVAVYINTSSDSKAGICSAVQQSSVLEKIKHKLDKGGGVYVYCGTEIHDYDHLQYHWWPKSCMTPMLFIYCFGTLHVTYD